MNKVSLIVSFHLCFIPQEKTKMVTTFSRREIISSENGIICLSHTPRQQ